MDAAKRLSHAGLDSTKRLSQAVEKTAADAGDATKAATAKTVRASSSFTPTRVQVQQAAIDASKVKLAPSDWKPAPVEHIKELLWSPMQPMNELAGSATAAASGASRRRNMGAVNQALDAEDDARDGLHKVTEGLTEAIVSVVVHARAPDVEMELAKQDVMTMQWLLNLTHSDAMELAEAVGLSRREMLLLCEACTDMNARHMRGTTNDSVGKESSSITTSGLGCGFLSLLCGTAALPLCIRSSQPARTAAPNQDAKETSRYNKFGHDRSTERRDKDFYAHVPKEVRDEWVEPSEREKGTTTSNGSGRSWLCRPAKRKASGPLATPPSPSGQVASRATIRATLEPRELAGTNKNHQDRAQGSLLHVRAGFVQ